MQRAAFFRPQQKHILELTIINNPIDANCLKKTHPRFLIIFIALTEGVFLF